MTITLHKLHSGFANIPATWSLEDYLMDDSRGDYSAEFVLPTGYTVAKNNLDQLTIYDETGNHCEIVCHTSGRPQLVCQGSTRPVLLAA